LVTPGSRPIHFVKSTEKEFCLNIFEKPAGTIGDNHKGFSRIGIKIHSAAGAPRNQKQQRQIRLMEDPSICALFLVFFYFSGIDLTK
jgi:hypothetical protein